MMDATLQRDLAGRETISRLLDAAGLAGAEHVIDYGGGRGVWSRAFPRSTVYDPFPDEWGEPTDTQSFTDQLDDIDQADAVMLIGTQQLLSHDETVAFLRFARDHVDPGGRVLVTVPSVWMVAEWLLRGVQPRRPLWLAQPALAMRPGYAGAYCTRWPVIVKLAEQNGLRHLASLSREMDREYQRMVGCVNTGRWYHWLVFEPK